MLPCFTHKDSKDCSNLSRKKTIRERGLWRGRIVCVVLNKVCMTHATRGLKQSKQPSLSSLSPPPLSPLLSHFFVITSSFQPFMSTPSSEPNAIACVFYGRLATVQCSAAEGAASAYGRVPPDAKPWSGSDRPSCLSQDLCPCCQFRVLLGGGKRGEGSAKTEKGRWWWRCGQLKIGNCSQTLSRGVVEVLSREMFNKCFVRGKRLM